MELSPASFPTVILTRGQLVWLLGLNLFLYQVERRKHKLKRPLPVLLLQGFMIHTLLSVSIWKEHTGRYTHAGRDMWMGSTLNSIIHFLGQAENPHIYLVIFIQHSVLSNNWFWINGLKWKKVLVSQSCLPIFNPMDCGPPGFSVCEISQARILEWVATFFSRGSSWPRDHTWVFCIVGRLLTIWATWEAHGLSIYFWGRGWQQGFLISLWQPFNILSPLLCIKLYESLLGKVKPAWINIGLICKKGGLLLTLS